jgi:hypothetical protein
VINVQQKKPQFRFIIVNFVTTTNYADLAMSVPLVTNFALLTNIKVPFWGKNSFTSIKKKNLFAESLDAKKIFQKKSKFGIVTISKHVFTFCARNTVQSTKLIT